MHQFFSRRRFGIFVFLIAAVLILGHFLNPTSHHTNSEKHDALGDVNEVNPDGLFYNMDQIASLGSSEPPLHRYSVKWAGKDGIPETRVLAHVPVGYTVLQNVFALNGTLVLVSERKHALPSLQYIISAWAEIPGGKTLIGIPGEGQIRVVNRQIALRLFGLSAREIRGTTWMYNNPIAYMDDSFVLEALRAHYMQEHRNYFNATLLPPARVMFPKISNKLHHTIPGLASIPRLLFPSTGTSFKEDWDDYLHSNRPIIFNSLVLIDRAAAARNPKISSSLESSKANLHILSPLKSFATINSKWWTQWRIRMAKLVSGSDATNWHGESRISVRPVITYISRQDEPTSRLRHEDHIELVAELEKLVHSQEYEVHILEHSKMSFLDRVRVSSRTSIMLGPTSSGLCDVMWMYPSSSSALVELFPDGYATTKGSEVSRMVGIPYLAWRGHR
ncbi:hypothetical protein CPB86DRAFT_864798 [Serendipita vermifera]|nr:hypothetical protein CPB86DRAFT_864798 [Serendipita vermifera]